MGYAHIAATESYLSYKEGKIGGEQLFFSSLPYYGVCTTYSANKHVTCSSAAGTAIACGEKTNNKYCGLDSDGKAIYSIADTLKKEGYKVGIMSNVPLNHATPAAFYAHTNSRNAYYDIARQLPMSGFDFFAGSGFIEDEGCEGRMHEIISDIEANGYTVCYGIDEFKNESVGQEKVMFLQERSRNSKVEVYVSGIKKEDDASLAQMLELGLEHLSDEDPFFIMCEGGTIDWGAHANRTMGTVMNIIEMDEAVKVAYDFYLRHKDETLIVVTADHETGGLTLGFGRDNENPNYETIDWETLEGDWIAAGKKNTLTWEENRRHNESCSLGWTTNHHTGGHVPVFAIGRGAEKFAGRIDNTEIKGKIIGE